METGSRYSRVRYLDRGEERKSKQNHGREPEDPVSRLLSSRADKMMVFALAMETADDRLTASGSSAGDGWWE